MCVVNSVGVAVTDCRKNEFDNKKKEWIQVKKGTTR